MIGRVDASHRTNLSHIVAHVSQSLLFEKSRSTYLQRFGGPAERRGGTDALKKSYSEASELQTRVDLASMS